MFVGTGEGAAAAAATALISAVAGATGTSAGAAIGNAFLASSEPSNNGTVVVPINLRYMLVPTDETVMRVEMDTGDSEVRANV